MKWQKIIVVIVGLGIVILGVWMFTSRREIVSANPSLTGQNLRTAATPKPQLASPVVSAVMPKGPYKGLDDPRWLIYWEKRKLDPRFEWKTPIAFYGKVVDQNQNPIAGVKVSMNWTDLSTNGTSSAVKITDEEGKFSIENIQGKNFGITALEKAGYQAAQATNRVTFEYAGFWEPTYYEPDSKNPAIFQLRKKGTPAPLVSVEGKTVVSFGTEVQVPMPGESKTNSPIKVSVIESDGKARRWKAQISVDGGGIVPALTEFPVKAPTEGYESSITVDQDSPQAPGWQDIDEGGWFYIKTTQGYGLLELRQMRGKKTLHYRVVLNSAGSTDLESGQ